MPVMALAFAASLAFAENANVQSAGWIDTDNGPQQLQNDPCNSGTNQSCRVILASDPGVVRQVFNSSDLEVEKMGGTETPYVIENE